jgi:hypothetical protein
MKELFDIALSSDSPPLARADVEDAISRGRRSQLLRAGSRIGLVAMASVAVVVGATIMRGSVHRTATGSGPSSSASPVIEGLLIATGECAGQSVTLSQPTEPPVPVLRLSPLPAINVTTMNNSDLRYLVGAGPCTQRLRMRTVGVLLQGSGGVRVDTFNSDGVTGLVARGVAPGGTEDVELFLECDSNTSCRPRPVAILRVDVRPGAARPTQHPSPLGVDDFHPGRDDTSAYTRVWAGNGRLGYALRSDIDSGGAPRTTDEVREMQRSGITARDVSVYETADGLTQIGVFKFGGGVDRTSSPG